MRRKKSEEQAVPPRADGRVTPMDVQQAEFRLAFRGYRERDVDAFLDRLTEDLSWYMEENQRLRSGAAPAPATGDDAAAASRDADTILTQAREQAAEIVRRAEVETSAIRAGGAGDARAAVAPFLNREREFLQSLGSLVQAHAEEIKEMVLALRARADAGREPASEPATADAPQPPAEAASAAEIRERLGEPEPERDSQGPERVVIDATEPAFSSEVAAAGEGRERSLRELFWGDE